MYEYFTHYQNEDSLSQQRLMNGEVRLNIKQRAIVRMHLTICGCGGFHACETSLQWRPKIQNPKLISVTLQRS